MNAPAKLKPLIFVLLDAPADSLGLSAQDKSVLIALASHYNAKRSGTEVWPSLARLSGLTGLSERTVRRSLRNIESLELIKCRSKAGTSNLYTINAEIIRGLAHPGHSDRGNAKVMHNPGHSDRGTPVTLAAPPGHCGPLTANRRAKGKSPLPTVGCSSTSKVLEDPRQRKLPVHGVVAGAADRMRVDDAKQPKIEKNEDSLLPKKARGRELVR